MSLPAFMESSLHKLAERKGKEKNSVPLAGWGTNPYCKVSIKHDILNNQAL